MCENYNHLRVKFIIEKGKVAWGEDCASRRNGQQSK